MSEIAAEIRATERARITGSPIDGYCLFVYVPRVAAESTTSASTRMAPLRTNPTAPGGNHLKKMLTAAMMCRSQPGEEFGLSDGDLILVADSGRH